MKRLLLLVLAAFALTLVLAACGGAAPECPEDEIGCVTIAPDEAIRIAYMLSVSGATAALGEDGKGGIEIAMADRGTLLEHEIELVGEDSLCSAEGGQTAATKLAADTQIVGIIGSTCSSEAVAGLPILSEAGLLMISPSNTSPRLTDPADAWLPGYYRTAHNDLFQGRVAADYAYNELGARTAATIHDGSPYAQSLQEVFAGRFAELGGELVFQGAVNVGDTDMRPILTNVAATPPDVMYFPIFQPEGDLIAAQSVEVAGLEETILMGADGLFADGFPESAGAAAVGMFLSGPYVAGATYDEFLAKWESQIGGVPPSGFHAHAYDATNMLLDAIEKVAVVGDDGTILIPRKALRDALTATTGFEGITGTLACSENGDCATGEALGVFELTEAEVSEGNWPPAAVWTP